MKLTITHLAIILFSFQLNAQTFTDLHSALPALQSSCAAFADYDNDGDQDLVFEGFSSLVAERGFIYRNDNGIMNVVDSSIIKISNGSVNWGDYDNDGDKDLLINGQNNGSGLTQLYRNDSNSVFTPVNTGIVGLIGIERWIDFNNDGWLDIVACGFENLTLNIISSIYKNNGNGTFTIFATNLPPLEANDISVADYDHDSLPDIFITGRNGQISFPFTALFHNSGNGNFIMDTASFRQMWTGTSKWGDVENDGDLDILYDGIIEDNTTFSLIYINDGSGNFTEQTNNLPGTGEPGSVDWADIDHDGDLDVALGGAFLMRNDGNGVFTDISPWGTGFFMLPIIFSDYDNDGDEDILAINYFGNNESTIYRNDLINGISNLEIDNKFLIYPNPVSNVLHISNSDNVTENNLRIFSSDGRIIIDYNSVTTSEVDLSRLSSGIYFIEFQSGNKSGRIPFVKM